MDLLTVLRAQWDRTIAVGAAAFGAVALFLGYLGVSDTPYIAAQLPYFISGGLFGIFLITIAATLWLSADLRDEWREMRLLREAVEASVSPTPTAAETDNHTVAAGASQSASNGASAASANPRRRAPARDLPGVRARRSAPEASP
jgi:hypothetical protein